MAKHSQPPPKRTRVIHDGEPRQHLFDSVTPPLVQSATYTFANTAEIVAFFEGRRDREEYGRYGNPTVRTLERKLAQLEGTENAAVFSSGMAAITSTLFALTKSGSHIVLFGDCYRRTRQFVSQFLARFGVEHTLVPPGDIEAVKAAIRPTTRLVIGEAPTNPYLHVPDLEALGALCKERGVHCMVDATFATPINLQPAVFGIGLVTHSATKYLAGHNDVLGGVVCGSDALISLIRETRDVLGGVCDPHAAYLIHRGVKTLALRVEQQNRSALQLARFLETHPKVERVWYPGLASHPNHEIASQLMAGHGGVVSFTLRCEASEVAKVVDGCRLPRIAPSLGGVESLIEQVAVMSYFGTPAEELAKLGISDRLVRYSVGVEECEDLIDDLRQALEAL